MISQHMQNHIRSLTLRLIFNVAVTAKHSLALMPGSMKIEVASYRPANHRCQKLNRGTAHVQRICQKGPER